MSSWDNDFERDFKKMLQAATPKHSFICLVISFVRTHLPQHREIAHVLHSRIVEVAKTSTEAKAAWFVVDAVVKDNPWLFVPSLAPYIPLMMENHLDWDESYAMDIYEGWRSLFQYHAVDLLGNMEGRVKPILTAKEESRKASKRSREETNTNTTAAAATTTTSAPPKKSLSSAQSKILKALGGGSGKNGSGSGGLSAGTIRTADSFVSVEDAMKKYLESKTAMMKAIALGYIGSSSSASTPGVGQLEAGGANNDKSKKDPSTAVVGIAPTSMTQPIFNIKNRSGAVAGPGGKKQTTKSFATNDVDTDEYIPL